MKKYKIIKRFLVWRLKNINKRGVILALSILVGFAVGIAAVVIKNSVHLIQKLLHLGISDMLFNYTYFAYPLIGILMVVLFVKYIIRKPVGHGIPSVLYAISTKNGNIKRHNMFSSILTSAFTVGFGGSVGLEGPTVSTGAAIGSNIGRFFHLNYKQVTLLLGCACAGAMAAIFKAPIAAVVFALEVIMLDLTMVSIVPILMASATAALTSYFFLGQNVLYPFDLQEKFVMADIPYYIILGILAGLISVYFTRTYMYFENIFEKIKGRYKKLMIGGLSLGLLIFLFPSLYGEGYEAINSCLKGDFSYLFSRSLMGLFEENLFSIVIGFLLVILLKVIATSITFGSGGVGGIFAPTLFMGANTGLLFATVVNSMGLKHISTSNFALVGMGGMIAGVLHAPLTAIFLIADITGGYNLFMPLMLTATIAYATVKIFEKNSVYTIQLAKRKELITHNKDKAVLTLMKIHNLIEKDFSIIQPDMTLGQLVKVVEKATRDVFPVVDTDGKLVGILKMNDIRDVMFKPKRYNLIFVHHLMYMPEVYVNYDDSMEHIAETIQKTGNFNFPVLQNNKYVGFISRANVFCHYRTMLEEFSDH